MLNDDLRARFTYHPPANDATVQAHEHVRRLLGDVAEHFDEVLPDCREKSVALTELQSAMMWANAAIAIHGLEEPPAPPRTLVWGDDGIEEAPPGFQTLADLLARSDATKGRDGQILELDLDRLNDRPEEPGVI